LLFHEGKDFLNVLNPVRSPSHIGVDRDGHEPGAFLSFLMQGCESVPRALINLGRAVMLDEINGDVIEFHTIGDGNQTP
jgi:hypothetical protein